VQFQQGVDALLDGLSATPPATKDGQYDFELTAMLHYSVTVMIGYHDHMKLQGAFNPQVNDCFSNASSAGFMGKPNGNNPVPETPELDVNNQPWSFCDNDDISPAINGGNGGMSNGGCTGGKLMAKCGSGSIDYSMLSNCVRHRSVIGAACCIVDKLPNRDWHRQCGLEESHSHIEPLLVSREGECRPSRMFAGERWRFHGGSHT
jgi:hypothetical protein